MIFCIEGVVFLNLHRMDKGYFPTSLIKYQVGETDVLYILQNKISIVDHGSTAQLLPPLILLPFAAYRKTKIVSPSKTVQ